MNSRQQPEADELLPGFARKQFEFTAHIRDPEHAPRPSDVEERRMAVYRDLLYKNVESFVSGTFPVLRSLTTDSDWDEMVRDFFARHQCHSPLFLEIPKEFLDYLTNEREPRPDDPPFLTELAHYEWVELALSVAEDPAVPDGVFADGDLLSGVPVVSPLAWVLSYRFPVHQIGPRFQPHEPGDQATHLLVYRSADDSVGFLELNTVTARLLALFAEDAPPTGRQALLRIAEELDHPQPATVVEGGASILEDLRTKHIILGCRHPGKPLS